MKKWIFCLATMLALCSGAIKAGALDDERARYDKDYALAIRYLRPMAEKGEAWAQFRLGVMYQQGQGVPQDLQEAVKWYRLAAAQGNADAQSNLEIMYRNRPGEVALSPDAPLSQQGTTSRSGSYLDRFAGGAVTGAVIGALLGLFILVRALIRKVKAPAKSATALTAAVGATAMQRLRQGIADYVGGTKECPFCKETVKARAVVCKHCHRDI